MTLLVLDGRTLLEALDMPTCIDAMHKTFVELANDAFFNPVRTRAEPDGSPNWLTMLPTLRHAEPRAWALKQMVVTPANPGRGLGVLQGSVLLHDGHDGRLRVIGDAFTLTAIRTAAVSALATRVLARPEAATVAVLGTGIQGRMHVQAMRTVLPQAEIRLWGRTRENADALARELGVTACASVQEAVRGADVVCTVTATKEPIVQRAWLSAGCHINAVGSSRPTARELESAVVAAAALFVDRREAALHESGDILGAIRDGAIGADHIRAELGEVLVGRQAGRTAPDQITLFKSLGLGAQDLAALEAAALSARRQGLGSEVPW